MINGQRPYAYPRRIALKNEVNGMAENDLRDVA